MTSAGKKNSLLANMPELLKIPDIMTPERMKAVDEIKNLDLEQIGKILEAAKKIESAKRDILTAENGLHDIREVLKVQNQVKYVSDIRDQIGMVAGYRGEDVVKVSENLAVISLIPNMTEDITAVLDMRPILEKVLSMEENIDDMVAVAEQIRHGVQTAEDLYLNTKECQMGANNVLNEIRIREKVIDEKLRKMEDIKSQMEDFSVDVDFIASGLAGSSRYSRTRNTLELRIPEGQTGPKGDSVQGERGIKGAPGIPGTAVKQGEKGDPGRDGVDFAPSLVGLKREMARYGNRPKGTSYLSLDESPVMIYFKVSDALNDWTEGQPFGINYSDEVEVTVKNSERLGGYTLEQIYKHIESALERITDGNT